MSAIYLLEFTLEDCDKWNVLLMLADDLVYLFVGSGIYINNSLKNNNNQLLYVLSIIMSTE